MLLGGAPVVKAHHCCEGVSSGSSLAIGEAGRADRLRRSARPPTLLRRGFNFAGWLVPSGILALLPKCPACLAAYFAIGGGIGISMSAAAHLRMVVIVLCVGSLSYFAARVGRTLLPAVFDIGQ